MEKTKIDPFISDLLYDHDCVIIADFGGFVANYKSSFLHPTQHTLLPPSKKIAFNSSLKMNDGLLASYIAENNSISYFEACKLISKYVEESYSALETGRKIQVDKVGSLYYNSEKNLQFSPDLSTNYLQESFGLTAVHSPSIKRESPVRKIQEFVPVPENSLNRETEEKTGKYSKSKKKLYNLKWIELLPAAAVLTLLLLNPAIIRNLNTGFAGLLPEIHLNNVFENVFLTKPTPFPVQHQKVIESYPPSAIKPDTYDSKTKTQEIKPITSEVFVNKTEATAEPSSGNNGVLSSAGIVKPVIEIKEAPVELSKPSAIETTKTTVSENMSPVFYIVAGCFKIEENANILHSELLSKGYASELIGKRKGLHLVTFQRATTNTEAHQIIEQLSEKNLEAWILKK